MNDIDLSGYGCRQGHTPDSAPLGVSSSAFEMRSGKNGLRLPTQLEFYDPDQWDMAREAGDAAGSAPATSGSEWTSTDNLAWARDELPPSVLVDSIERWCPGAQQIFSPFDPSPATSAALGRVHRAARITAWTPLSHAWAESKAQELRRDEGPIGTYQRQSHPNRDFGGATERDVIYLSVNAELVELSQDVHDLVRRCRAALRDNGVFVIFVSRSEIRVKRSFRRWLLRQAVETIDLDHGKVHVLRRRVQGVDRLRDCVEQALKKYLVKDPKSRAPKVLEFVRRQGPENIVKRLRRPARQASRGSRWHHRDRAARNVARLAAEAFQPVLARRLKAFFHGAHGVDVPTQRSIPKNALKHRAKRRREETGREARGGDKPWVPQMRTIVKFPLLNRIFLGLLNEMLTPHVEPVLTPVAIGGRPGSRFSRIVAKLRRLYEQCPRLYSAEADISACFDEVDHAELSKVLSRHLPGKWSQALIRLIGDLNPGGKGLGQGCPLSMQVLNLLLHEIADTAMLKHDVRAYRYVDDWALIGTDRKAVARASAELKARMKQAGLRLNKEKSRLAPKSGCLSFLGLTFRKGGVQPEDGVMSSIRSLVTDGDPPRGSLVYFRRVLSRDEFIAAFGELFLDDIWFELIAADDDRDAPTIGGGRPLFPSHKSSRSGQRARAALGTQAPDELFAPELKWGPPDGSWLGAIFTPFPELDAWAPICWGSVVGFTSPKSDHLTRFIIREILKRSGLRPDEILWVDPMGWLLNEQHEEAERASNQGVCDIGRHGPADVQIVGPENYDVGVLGQLYPFKDVELDMTYVRDAADPATTPDSPGLCCEWIDAAVRGTRDRWKNHVIENVKLGRHRVVVLRLQALMGEIGPRTPRAGREDALLDLERAADECERRHGFRPTIFWISDQSGWIDPRDGLNGIRPEGGQFWSNHSDLLIAVDGSVVTWPPRKRVARGARYPEFRHVTYNFRLTARKRNGEREDFRTSYKAYTHPDEPVPDDHLKRREHDEAGRMMFSMGWDKDPPDYLRAMRLARRKAYLGCDAVRNEVRARLRARFMDHDAVPELAAPPRSPSGTRSVRLAGAGPDDPRIGGEIERLLLERLAPMTGTTQTPASGSGMIGGDLQSDVLCAEVKVTTKRSRRLSVRELQKISANARQEAKVAVHITAFVNHSAFFCYVESGASQPGRTRVKGRSLALTPESEPPAQISFEEWPEDTWTLYRVCDLPDLEGKSGSGPPRGGESLLDLNR